jgi:hypothetical protein
MAKFLSEAKYAVRGRLVAVDDSGMVGPMFTLRVPPSTFDVQRPGSYIDLELLDTNRKTLQKRFGMGDELEVILHAAATTISAGTRNEVTFEVSPRAQCQRISYCRRVFTSISPVNGKVIDNDEHHMLVVDAGLPFVVSLLDFKPTQTKEVKVNAWVTFWPTPPTHGVILGKV